MHSQIVRHLIDEFGRSTLIDAAQMRADGLEDNTISSDLGIPEDHIEACVTAGGILQVVAEEQRRFEDSICEPC